MAALLPALRTSLLAFLSDALMAALLPALLPALLGYLKNAQKEPPTRPLS
jgi:hypothetical protein